MSTTSWKDIRTRRVGPADEATITEIREQMDAELRLAALRKHRKTSQATLAKRLGSSQPRISNLERSGSDPKLSTIERYVDALGGRMEYLAVFPDEQVRLSFDLAPVDKDGTALAGFGKFSVRESRPMRRSTHVSSRKASVKASGGSARSARKASRSKTTSRATSNRKQKTR